MNKENQQNQINQQSQENPQNLQKSPNLFDSQSFPDTIEKKIRPKALISIKALILGVFALFLLVLTLNLFFQNIVREETIRSIRLRQNYRSLIAHRKTVIELQENINSYKNIRSGLQKLSPLTSEFLTLKPENLVFRGYSVASSKISVNAVSDTPITFALYTEELFEKTAASEIVLISASLSGNQDYELNFEIRFE